MEANDEPLAQALVVTMASFADIIARQPAVHIESYLHNLREATKAAEDSKNPYLIVIWRGMLKAAEKVAPPNL